MFKRLAVIAFLTGIGQLGSVFAIRFTVQKVTPDLMAPVAFSDALVFFLINLIALGLQPVAMRNIAVSRDWQMQYLRVQSARVTFGLLLALPAFLAFSQPVYIVFLMAPLLALSGDYALYALGKPVQGAIVACCRALVPYGTLVASAYFYPHGIIFLFFFSWVLVYLITNAVIGRLLHMDVWVLPRWVNLKRYLTSLPLGIVSLSFYFLGLGIVLILPYFYAPATTAAAFVGLKFYVIFKGVLRIIHQAFLREMMEDEWCLRIDQLSIILALLFLGSLVFFPHTFISTFFSGQYLGQEDYFLLLGIAALLYSFVLSATTRALLDKKDRSYMVVSTLAALVALLAVVILSFFGSLTVYIAVSVLAGEALLLAGLIFISSGKGLIRPRLIFLFQCLPGLVLFFLSRYFFEDHLLPYVLGCGLTAALLIGINLKKFIQYGKGKPGEPAPQAGGLNI